MKTFNFVKILLFTVVTLGFASCGDDVYYTMQNSNNKLCARTWVEEYVTMDNELCKHYLKFAPDRSGREIFQFYRNGESRPYQEKSLIFDWRWLDADMENMEMNYGAGDIIYFDNVWVREHNLSGKLDGEVVMFVDEAYY